MTQQPTPSPTDVPKAPPAPEPEQTAWSLRRTLRTATSESWDLDAENGDRAGTLTLVYGGEVVEGLLALPAGTAPEAVRGILAWLTGLLTLDSAAGPGGVIHWSVSTGGLEDFWRRSPGHRATGMENDVATARARIEPVLQGMFPEMATLPDGGYAVDTGSVRVFVGLRVVDGAVLVRVFSITNLDVTIAGGDLAAFLLNLNFAMPVGRFSLDLEHRAVWLDHVLTGEQLDDATLSRTIATVAGTADRYDDEIKQRFGGRTFREEGSPVEQASRAATAEPGMAGGYL